MNVIALRKVFRGKGIAGVIFRTSFTNVIVLVLTTLTSILTTRLLGVVGKGELAAILFWPMFLTGLLSLGLPTSLIYNLKKDTEHAEDYIKLCMLVLLPLGVLAGIIAWFFIPVWLQQYSGPAIRIAQVFTLVMMPLQLGMMLLSSLSKALDQFQIYNRLKSSPPLINLITLSALWLLGSLNLLTSALVYLVTTVIVVIYCINSLRKHLTFRAKGLSRTRAKPLFGYGINVYGMELLGSLYTQADKIIIISLLSPRDFGLYTVLFSLSRIFNAVQNAISEVIFPKVTGKAPGVIIATVSRAFRTSMLIMSVILIPSLFIGKYLIGLLFGSQFLAESSTFYILSLECIIGGGSWILASSFNAIGRPGMVLIRQIIAIIITVSLFFVMAPLFGLTGVALALLAGGIVRLGITLLQISRVFDVPLGSVLYDRNDFRYMTTVARERFLRKGVRVDANDN